MVNRRGLLRRLGGFVTSSTLVQGLQAKGQVTGEEPRQPSESAATTEVSIFSNAPSRALDSEWVIHTFGWRTEHGETKTDLLQIRDAAEYDFRIDEESIDQPHQYWQPVTKEDGRYCLRWKYPVPPEELKTGLHRFVLTISFRPPFRSSRDSRRWEGEYTLSTPYQTITPEKIEYQRLIEVLEYVQHQLEEKHHERVRLEERLATLQDDASGEGPIDSVSEMKSQRELASDIATVESEIAELKKRRQEITNKLKRRDAS